MCTFIYVLKFFIFFYFNKLDKMIITNVLFLLIIIPLVLTYRFEHFELFEPSIDCKIAKLQHESLRNNLMSLNAYFTSSFITSKKGVFCF